MCKKKYDSIQIDMFSSIFDGSTESKKEREIKDKINGQKRRDRWRLKQKEKKMEELYQFEKKHPESFLFSEFRP